MKTNLKAAFSRFLRDEEGTEMVEWAIVGGLVVAVGAAVFGTIGTGANTALTTLDGEVQNAANGGAAAGG